MTTVTVKAAQETVTVDYSVGSPPAYPDATTTGARGTLTNYTGNMRPTANGLVFQNLRFTDGDLILTGSGHTFRNCEFISNSYWPLRFDSETGVQSIIEDCTFKTGPTSQCGMGGSNFAIRRCDISGPADGIKGFNNVLIEDNYVHDLYGEAGSHRDGIDCEGTLNITIRHNTVLMPTSDTSCITVARYTNNGQYTFNNCLVENNLLAGAGYCIYGPGTNAPTPTNVRIINNKFWKKYYPKYGYWGWMAYEPPTPGNGNIISGNVDYITGLAL